MTTMLEPPQAASEAAPPEPPARSVSPRLMEPLRIVAGRTRMLAFFQAAFKFFVLAAVTWLVTVLILGSRVQVSGWVAIPLIVITWLIVLAGGVRLFKPVLKRQNLAAAAYLVDQALPDTQERISSAVELSQEKDLATRGSPELIACLIRQAEHHADCMNPTAVVSGKEVSRWLGVVMVVGLTWFVLLVLLTPNVLLGLRRTFAPWLAAQALPLPQLVIAPEGDQVLAQGQDFQIDLEVQPPQGLSLDSENQQVPHATFFQHFTGTSGGQAIPDRATEMERTGNRAFRVILKNVQQGFVYHVAIDGSANIGRAQSPPYTVTVQTRPGVLSMRLMYTYPAYTHLEPRTDLSGEGHIDGLIGSKVHVSLQTTQPVTSAQLVIEDNGAGRVTLPLVAGAADASNMAATLTTDLTIVKSTTYHVELKNAQGRDNPDNHPRPIDARPDMPPEISITSPTTTMKVRPDDLVPIQFRAKDDFGITDITAMVQVDDLAVVAVPVTIPADQATISDQFNLALADVIKRASVAGAKDPRHITYQLKVTDNREPEAQSALSAKQMLDLDKNTTPLAQRQDKEATKALADAIKSAASKLRSAEQNLDDLKKSDTNHTLSDKDIQRLTEAQKAINDAREQLNQGADQAEASRLNDLARQVRDVAEQPVKRAQEDAVKSQLAADQAPARKQSEESAAQNVADARSRLDQLAETLRDTAKDQPLAQSLERLAQQQQQVADALAKNPNDQNALNQQKELQKQLDDLIKNNPQLQRPVADANQSRVNDLVRRLQQIEQSQQSVADPLGNQQSPANAADARQKLAQEQQELNQQINQFSQQQSGALNSAGAKPPAASKMDPIVKSIQDDKLSNANTEQKSLANQLEQLQNKLENEQQKIDKSAGTAQKTAEQADQAAKEAGQFQQDAKKIAQEIQDAKDKHTPPTRPSDQANKDAAALADQIKKAAQALQQNPASKAQAQEASKAADAAKQAAARGQAETAQQQAAQAADQLAAAAKAAQGAAGSATPGSVNSAGQAAQQARDLAVRERALADKTAQQGQGEEAAAGSRNNANATANKQQALADRLAGAAQDAQSLQQQSQGAPALAQKAGDAAQALEKSAQAQREAAQATRNLDAPGALVRQSQAADQAAAAEEALTGQPRPRTPPNGGERPGQTASNGQTPGQTPQNSGQAPGPSSAQNSAQAPGQTPGQNSGQNSAQTPGQSASQTASGLPGQSPGQTPGQTSGQAPSPSAGGSSLGAGSPGTTQSPSGSPTAGGSPSASGSPSANGSPSAGASPSGAPGQGQTQGQGQGGVAQAVQAARNAQSQAAGGSGSAAQQAADQLSQAARQLTPSGQPGQNPGGASGQTAMGPSQPGAGQSGSGQGGAGAGQPGSGQPGASGSPGGANGQPGATGGGGGGGITQTFNGRPTEPPKEVQEVGISPSEWAKLPPKVQDELLHSAQQSGPPGYRDMIKNYYSKIARLQPE